MLTRLYVRNVVLISELDLEFDSGLTVLTGETGAGKSILLDAMGLALGRKADFGLISEGETRAEVTACFALSHDHPVRAILSEAEIEADDEVILHRSLRKSGSSSARINDRPISLGLLKQVGDSLIEIQGQHEGRGLLDTSTHRDLLDRYASAEDLVAEISDAWHEWGEAKKALEERESELAEVKADEDWLKAAVAELEKLAPQSGEEESLNQERNMLANSNRISESLQQIEAALSDEAGGAATQLGRAEKALAQIADLGGEALASLGEALARSQAELTEASAQLNAAIERLAHDPNRLNTIEDRLHALRSTARKHKTETDSLPQIHQELAKKLNDLDTQTDIEALKQNETEAQNRYRSLVSKLTEQRIAAGKTLDGKVVAELPELKFDQASFITQIEPLAEERWSKHGGDSIRFIAATNQGQKPNAIDKIASGGELARFLLALKVVLADASFPMTLIFDEVDRGVGGAVATAVGARLARLGEKMQCLVITHSPQVAARAHHHFRISKSESQSTATLLSEKERSEEIARMLSGSKTTSEARAAALKLLEVE